MTVASTAVLDALATLIDYPDPDLQPRVARCLARMRTTSPAAAAELERFAAAIAALPTGALQERYTETFDMDPECALDVGWHLFGEAHERGRFMAALREDVERIGAPETPELPDHLTRVLMLLGRETPARAAALAELIAPALGRMHRALVARASPYVHVLAAIQAVVAEIGAEDRQEVTRS